jgi:putative ABC transport system permease protein
VDLRHVPTDRRGVVLAQMVERVRAIPGVRSASQASFTPVSGSTWNNTIVVDGKAQGVSNFNSVGPGFFKTLGTPMVAGRDFDAHDVPSSAVVAIVNEAFARTFFPGRGALGQHFQIDLPPGVPRPSYQIVGLVKDTKYTDLREPFGPIAFLAGGQDKEIDPFVQIAVATDAPLASVSQGVTQVLTDVDHSVLIQHQSMASQLRESLLSERLMATLSGFFGGLAGVIAAIGLYGVMSYMVARRKVEIGIRMALGADRGAVIRLVLREAGLLLAAGIVVGAVLASYAAHAAASLLYGLGAWDPLTFAAAVFILGAAGLFASWLPARRAAHLAPTMALREE